jgi:hypothetical protein
MNATATFESLVKQHYPKAMTEAAFRGKVRAALADCGHSIDPDKVLLVTSLCADDIIALRGPETPSHKIKIKNDFLGPFFMGGLAGLPYSGLTGMLTVGHHIPDGGSVLVAYGPHIGLSDQGEPGKLLRPGQQVESPACGALALALRHFQSSPDYMPPDNDDDTEQMTLERRLLPYRKHILAADNPLKAATDCAYNIIHELIGRYLHSQKKAFNCEHIALAGGIIINTSHQHDDYIDLRHLSVRRVEEL